METEQSPSKKYPEESRRITEPWNRSDFLTVLEEAQVFIESRHPMAKEGWFQYGRNVSLYRCGMDEELLASSSVDQPETLEGDSTRVMRLCALWNLAKYEQVLQEFRLREWSNAPRDELDATLYHCRSMAALGDFAGALAQAEERVLVCDEQGLDDSKALIEASYFAEHLERYELAESFVSRVIDRGVLAGEEVMCRARYRFGRGDMRGSASDAVVSLSIAGNEVSDLRYWVAVALTFESCQLAVRRFPTRRSLVDWLLRASESICASVGHDSLNWWTEAGVLLAATTLNEYSGTSDLMARVVRCKAKIGDFPFHRTLVRSAWTKWLRQ